MLFTDEYVMKELQYKKSIIIAGDLFPNSCNSDEFFQGRILSLFGEQICKLFADSDYSICNLEGAFSNGIERCDKTGPIKVDRTESTRAYKNLGINCCLLANNHITDGGHQGVLDTMKALDEVGIDYIGAGINQDSITHSRIERIGDSNVGFYNVSETMYNRPSAEKAGVWLYDEYVVCQEIKELKAQCDFVIVLYHGGIEKFQYPSPELRKRFYRMADNGADVVIAQHTHCIGCEENYKGSYLLYGQGDFLLNDFAPGLTDTGLIIELVLSDGHLNVNKHLVRSKDKKFVRYDDQQDLSSFVERSKMVGDEEYVWRQLQAFCDNELRLYLTAFKSPSRLRLLQKRYFPQAYKKWLFDYRKKDLMFTLHTLRSEQNRETAIVGLEHLLSKKQSN